MTTALLVALFAASVVSQERSRQSLIVLLTTPLTAREILDQKLAGVDRLIAVLAMPLATLCLFQYWWHSPTSFEYLLLSAASLGIYLPTVKWLATELGLRMRTQLIAIVATVCALAIWTVALAFAVPVLRQFHADSPPARALVSVLSPFDVLRAIQRTAIPDTAFVPNSRERDLPFLLHFAFYGAVCLLLRYHCFRNIDRRLGRIPQPS
jgi:ABC-type transport system involved in multi-copper enzyme maturation permease subunit